MPRGNPVIYDSKYCDELVEHCAQGFSPTAFAGKIRISRALLMRWAETHPEFKDAMEIARAARTGWHEAVAHNIMRDGGTGGQAAVLQFTLKNISPEDYRDRQEITGAEGRPLIEDADPKRLAATVIELLRTATGQKGGSQGEVAQEKDANIKGFGENDETKP